MTKLIVALGICIFLFPRSSHYCLAKAGGIWTAKWFVLKAFISTQTLSSEGAFVVYATQSSIFVSYDKCLSKSVILAAFPYS